MCEKWGTDKRDCGLSLKWLVLAAKSESKQKQVRALWSQVVETSSLHLTGSIKCFYNSTTNHCSPIDLLFVIFPNPTGDSFETSANATKLRRLPSEGTKVHIGVLREWSTYMFGNLNCRSWKSKMGKKFETCNIARPNRSWSRWSLFNSLDQ